MRRFLATLAISAFVASPLIAQQMVVSTDWLQANLQKVRVVEIGDRAGYDAGHIRGAALIEFSSIVTNVDGVLNELPPIEKLEAVFRNAGVGETGRIVIYSHDPLHAARAWWTLDYLGHGAQASVLDGGWAKWTAEGRPVSKDAVTPKPAVFQAQVHAAALTRLQPIQNLVRNSGALGSNLLLIDARPPAQFTGEERGDGVKKGGHIPGAINVPWPENFTSGQTPVLRPVDELRKLYDSIGMTNTSANVVYCRTGVQASATYFVLKYIGYDATLYDGSFSEWSNRDQPVE